MRRAPLMVLVALVLAGCAQPEPTPNAQPDPEAALAPTVVEHEPSPLAVEPAPAATPSLAASPAGDSAPSASDDSPAPPVSAPSPDPAEPQQPGASEAEETSVPATREPTVLLALSDARGDHGIEGPAWVDLVTFEFVDLGSELEVTLRFAAELPSAPPDGEVPLIGVDILEQESGESAYQLFVEGGGQQWGAHLQTPQGFVPFPGTFVIGGRAMTLTLPWNTLGSPTRGPVRAYVEWSRERLLINPTSRDTLDGQPHTFDRNP